MKKNIIATLSVLTLALTACNATEDNYKRAISPSGAPAIAFYDQTKTDYFETNSTPANVLAQLQADNYGMVVFDFYNGLKSLKANQGHYKLAKIITGGNLYLVGINKTEAPTVDDYIVSFGKNLLPDIVYKEIYGEDIAEVTHYVNAVNDAQGVLVSGLHEGHLVDYVLIAQPALFATLNNVNAATYGTLTVIDSLREKWTEKTEQTAIPQAGLFLNMQYYVNHKSYYDDQLALLDERIETCIDDPLTMKTKIETDLPSEDDQKALFGFTSKVAYNVQKDGANGFALVRGEETIDIHGFLTSLNILEDYSDFIL